MPQPAHFKQTIQRVIEYCSSSDQAQALTPEQLADEIVKGLNIAEAIMGDGPRAPQPIQPAQSSLIIPPTVSQFPAVDLSKGLTLNSLSSNMPEAEAPPAAKIRNPEGYSAQDTPDEIERKKSLLQAQLLQVLPATLSIHIPALGRQLALTRYLKPAPAGLNFIRILYGQFQDEEDGPQVQVSTADLDKSQSQSQGQDLSWITAEILKQAAMRYRKDRPRIEPRLAPSPGMPDVDQLNAQAFANAKDDKPDPDAIRDWNRWAGSSLK